MSTRSCETRTTTAHTAILAPVVDPMTLEQAIEHLYRQFSKYPLDGAAFCTFCHSAERIEVLLTTPLHQIDADLGRVLLWESADHWGSDAAYKHFLPRLFELMAPPTALDPLYPDHPFEVLCQRGFRRWPPSEQTAVRNFILALEDEDAARFVGPAFDPCSALTLEAHCPARIGSRPWARVVGYAQASWRGPAVPPAEWTVQEVTVQAPFLATADEPFHLLWEPPQVERNGWEPTDGPLLADVRIVQCRLLSLLERSEDTHAHARILVEVRSVLDPLDFAQTLPAEEASLAGLLIDAGPAVHKRIVRGSDRVLVETTMQGDINFGLLMSPDASAIVLLRDTSICRGFFWAGHGAVGDDERSRVLAD